MKSNAYKKPHGIVNIFFTSDSIAIVYLSAYIWSK